MAKKGGKGSIERKTGLPEEDLFEQVFGPDEEREAARARAAKEREEKEQKTGKAKAAAKDKEEPEEDEDEDLDEEDDEDLDEEDDDEGEDDDEEEDDEDYKKDKDLDEDDEDLDEELDDEEDDEDEDEDDEEREEEPKAKKKPARRKRAAPRKKPSVKKAAKPKSKPAPRPRRTRKKKEEEPEMVEAGSEEEEKLLRKAGVETLKDEDVLHEEAAHEKGTKSLPAEKKKAKEDAEKKTGKRAETGILPRLELLRDEKADTVYIGRKKRLNEKFGQLGALNVGRVEEEEFHHNSVLLDSLNPHVVFICGARGSGKSYALGVLAEELSKKNPNVGTIVVDPIGVFWSMRFPNKEEKELEALKEWGLPPEAVQKQAVFIPKGVEGETPKNTYDKTFSLRASLLTAQDWCLTFSIDRFSPTGLLLEKVLDKVKKGFTDLEERKHGGKGNTYTLEDMIYCLNNDLDLHNREKGYKADSIRALSSRFDAAKSWGIFSEKGTPLSELSKPGQLTIIDTSFLDDNVTALVIGVLARRILAARKMSTRKEAAKRFETVDMDELLELEIPPTWMFIDEAHTLIPAGNVKTAATDALVEYTKQGRRPGCSLVFATQQPSAIDTHVLSQLDTILIHKLVFADDIKAVFKRTPSILPAKYRQGGFIKTLPIGTCMVGDRQEETSRAFIMKVRPRQSQHEGREAETTDAAVKLSPSQVENLAVEMTWRRLQSGIDLDPEDVESALDTLNSKYDTEVKVEAVQKKLKKRGAFVEGNIISLSKPEKTTPKKRAEPEEDIDEEDEDIDEEDEGDGGEEGDEGEDEDDEEREDDLDREDEEALALLTLPLNVSLEQAKSVVERTRKKRMLGVFGEEEYLENVELKHAVIYRVFFNWNEDEEHYRTGTLFMNAHNGEFLHHKKDRFIESKGMRHFYNLTEREVRVLNFIGATSKRVDQIAKRSEIEEKELKRHLARLKTKGLVGIEKDRAEQYFFISTRLDVPRDPFHSLLQSITELPVAEVESVSKKPESITKRQVEDTLPKLWEKLEVTDIEELYLPVYEATFRRPKGETREVLVEGVHGRVLGETRLPVR